MPDLAYADQLHAEKYRAPGETFREAMNRNASALKDDDAHFRALQDAYQNQRFLNAGRVQAGAGSPRHVTMHNCYVMPTIEDSFTEGENSIMNVARKAAQTMRMGGGVGYDFSTLRPRGDQIRTLGSRSSGPISFMEIYDAVCRATMSAGHRRGAQMGVLRVDHPDIEEFVRAKQTPGRLTGFNVSVGVTDEFMRAVINREQFALRWGGDVRSWVDANALWEEIMRSTWDWAEPGVIFLDAMNRDNNLWYCEQIAATNPCSEQPLPPNGACLLGSANLTKYVARPTSAPHDSRGWASYKVFDYDRLRQDLHAAARALDNVVDRSIYPLPEQAEEAYAKRRMGIGVTGLANAIEALGHRYGSDGFLEVEGTIMAFVRDECYRASVARAAERGAFPAFVRDAYLEGEFVKRLPADIRDGIAEHGIRNSHLTSVAPTGTISVCADNVSSGVEPPYALSYTRRVREFDGERDVEVQDYAYRVWGIRGKTATECTIDEHLSVLAVAQRFVDSAVSKTINVDPHTPWEAFKDTYRKAWELGTKGCTTFNPAGKRGGILTETPTPDDEIACRIDAETGARTCE